MGGNEHGVAIGAETVRTGRRAGSQAGLPGTDLLRLGLERATTAREAVEVIVALLEEHGQRGRPGSFLVADPEHAIVLETAGGEWASEDVRTPARSIGNGLTIPGFAEAHNDRLRSRVGSGAVRRDLTQRLAGDARGVVGAMRVLRQNGTGLGPRWSPVNGSMAGPNVHAGGLLASRQTTASWVSDLGSGIHWSTGTSDPAFSLFVPLRVDQPVAEADYPTADVTDRRDDRSLWWRHEQLHRRALRDWLRAERVVSTDRDRLQRAWVSQPPSTEEALAEVRAAHQRWLPAVTQVTGRDARPWWARRRWASFDHAAGQPSSNALSS